MRNEDISPEPEEFLEDLPDREGEFLESISELVDEGELEQARDVLDRALERAATPALRLTQTRICLETGNVVRARKVLAPLRSTADPGPRVLLLSARVAARTGNLKTADRELERARAAGAEPTEVRDLRKWFDELDGDTVRQDAISTEEMESSSPSTPTTVEIDADFESLVQASDEVTPGSPPRDLQKTSKTSFAQTEEETVGETEETEAADGSTESLPKFEEPGDTTRSDVQPASEVEALEASPDETAESKLPKESLLEEATGVESEENPFEAGDDTVLDESPPSSAESTGEAGSSEGSEGGDKIGRSIDRADTDFYDDAEPTAFQADVSPKHERDDQEERPSDDEASDVFRITSDPSGSGIALEALLVDQPRPEAQQEADSGETEFESLETNPVHELAEERGDVQLAETEPTQLIDAPGRSGEETGEPDNHEAPTEKLESGVTDADAPAATADRPTEESESTIEIDEELRSEAEEAAARESALSKGVEEFEAATDPAVPAARNPQTEGAENEVPTDPDRPIGRQRGPRREEEIPTDPEKPADPDGSKETAHERPSVRSGGGPPSGRDAEPLDDDARENRQRSGGRGPAGGTPAAEQQRSAQQAPKLGERDRAARAGSSGESPGRSSAQKRDRQTPSASPRDSGDGSEPEDASRPEPSGDSPERAAVGERQRLERPSTPAARTGGSDARSDEGFFSRVDRRLPLPTGMNSRGLMLVTGISILSFAVALLFVAGVTARFDARDLETKLERIRSARSADTYSGWVDSYEIAKKRATLRPGIIRRTMYAVGALVPGQRPLTLLERVEVEYAYTAAMIEYRFEAPGSRDAKAVASRMLPGSRDVPMRATSATYRLLARGRASQAVDRARTGHQKFGTDRRLENAYLEALLQAEKSAEVKRERETIREGREQLSVYERYLLARAAVYSSDSAVTLLEKLIEDHSPDHLDARIDRVRALIDRGDHERATTSAQRLLENRSDAAPHQVARLRIALGDAYRALDEMARAEEQYRRAIEAHPERTSIYLPLTDLFIADGRLDEARDQVESARSRAGDTPRLRVRAAQLEFLRGKFEDALETLGEESDASNEAPILRGRILLELGSYKEARTVLNSLSSSHPDYPDAKSLELVARARMGVADDETVLDEIEALRGDRPDSPLVLRSAARILLHFARGASGETRREYLERANELLNEATDVQPDRALHYYLLCEAHLLADRASEAAETCRRARDKNPKFLPGLSTVARLWLLEGNLSRADTLVSRLAEKFEQRWDIAALRIRSAIRNHNLDNAREILNEWLQRAESETPQFKLFEGQLAFARADYTQAVGYFEKARESPRHKKEASLYYAHALARIGELDKAVEPVRDLTRSRRWEAAAWLVFGEIRRRQHRYDDALENLDLAEHHYESDFAPPWRIAHLYAERAFVWRDREGWDDPRVLENLARGKSRGDSESPEIQLGYGLHFYEGPERDLERAATHFEKVVELQPYRCRAVRALVDIYGELDRREERDRVEKLADQNCE